MPFIISVDQYIILIPFKAYPDYHYCAGDGFSGGPSAESLMADGHFPGVIATQWTRGQAEKVRGGRG